MEEFHHILWTYHLLFTFTSARGQSQCFGVTAVSICYGQRLWPMGESALLCVASIVIPVLHPLHEIKLLTPLNFGAFLTNYYKQTSGN